MLCLFGEPRFANQPVPLERALLLLSLLACREGWVSRDELILLLWNDTNETTGRHRLRQLLYRSRNLPFASGIEADASRLRLQAITDVQLFRAAIKQGNWAEAISLYQGELLAHMPLPDHPELESFFALSREEFAAQYRYAVLMQAAKLEPDAALTLLDSALERDPLAADVLRECLRLAALGRAEVGKRVFARFVRAMQALEIEIDEEWWGLERQLENTAGTAWLPPMPKTSLPVMGTTFIGRQNELQDIAALLGLGSCRLITVLGLGGVGKTRLAIEAARLHQDRFRDGAVFVELAACTDLALAPNIILEALHIGGEQSKARLLANLADKAMLLVLDNLEQLQGIGDLVHDILQAAPEVRLITTSREGLGLAAEHLLALGGLPELDAELPLLSQDAAQVFIQAAKRSLPDFVLANEHTALFERIYAAVSGMPLGLELAASWVRVMSLLEIAQALEANLDLLEPTHPNAPERHRSFAAVFDSSWRLLSLPERLALGRMALLRAGFDREMAQQIADCSVGMLLRLVNKSLVKQQSTRFSLHEMIRQYAERKSTPKERQQTLNALALTCLEWSKAWHTSLSSEHQSQWGQKLELEHDNLRAALAWALQNAPRLGAEIAGYLDHFWFVRGHHFEGLTWFERFLSAPELEPRDLIRLRLLWGAASMCKELNQYDQSRGYIAQHQTLAQELGDQHAVAMAQRFLGLLVCDQGEPATARGYLERAKNTFETLGDMVQVGICYSDIGNAFFYEDNMLDAKINIEKSLEFKRQFDDKQGIAYALAGLSNIASMLGDSHTDRLLQAEALRLKRELGDAPGIANSLFALGDAARHQGEFQTTRKYFNEALEIYMHLGRKLGVANLLLAYAQLEVQLGQFDEALRLGAAALALLKRIKVEPRKSNLDTMRQIREAQPFSAAQGLLFELEGERMGIEEVVKHTLGRLSFIPSIVHL